MRNKRFVPAIVSPALAALVGISACLDACADPTPIRVLLYSGQNNHDWKRTTPKLVDILTASGRFRVEVTERPDQCTSNDFARCDVILCNWNGWGKAAVTNWPAATREAFLNFVRRGGGHVVVHAGSSSFYDWPEYQQLAGASWKLGETRHGAPHEFTVQAAGDHPITRGVPSFKTKDELWLQPGVQPDARVIATGDEQPLALTTRFGKGRGFTLLLGHSADFMDTPGFQTLLLRGTEWAATGKVTIRGAGEAGLEGRQHSCQNLAPGDENAAFPLTPALSLGEREPWQPAPGEPDAHGPIPTLDAFLPLPRGEGQGEGEGNARFCSIWTATRNDQPR